jgi:hypothetical protein
MSILAGFGCPDKVWGVFSPMVRKGICEAGRGEVSSIDDERLLQGFHLVQQSHEGYQHEGAFDQICQRAGLLHSDVGLLGGRVQTLFQTREPILYEAEAYAILHQWLRNKEGEE